MGDTDLGPGEYRVDENLTARDPGPDPEYDDSIYGETIGERSGKVPGPGWVVHEPYNGSMTFFTDEQIVQQARAAATEGNVEADPARMADPAYCAELVGEAWQYQ